MVPAGSPYTIRLNEVPLKETPSSISIRNRDALTAAISTAGATTCTVMNGAWFTSGDVIAIENEQALVTSVADNTLTITRGYNGTTAATHPVSTPVYGPAWAEVAATPAAKQFWPDYGTGADSDEHWNTGTVQFNPADAGVVVDIAYNGTGTLASVTPSLSYQPWMSSYGDGSDGHFISSGSDTIDGAKQYKSFTVLPGHTVNVGALPLWIFCQGAITIHGTLNGAGGSGSSNQQFGGVAGTSRGGASTGVSRNIGTDDLGAAGGGATSRGGSFWRGLQVAAANSTPAAAYQVMMALSADPGGGCAGTAGGSDHAGQGGSGGSIVIACRRYRNVGTLSVAAGANGAASGAYQGFGGGGGAGIKIVAPSVSIALGGVVTVAGGNGGAGNYEFAGNASAPGWYKVFESN
jgi:hypothetical protein